MSSGPRTSGEVDRFQDLQRSRGGDAIKNVGAAGQQAAGAGTRPEHP